MHANISINACLCVYVYVFIDFSVIVYILFWVTLCVPYAFANSHTQRAPTASRA